MKRRKLPDRQELRQELFVILIKSGLLELVTFQPQPGARSRTRRLTRQTASQTQNRPIALRSRPLKDAVGVHKSGNIDYFIGWNQSV